MPGRAGPEGVAPSVTVKRAPALALAGHQATPGIRAGHAGAADSTTVAGWITETEARRKAAAARLTAQHRTQLSRNQIAGLVRAAGDIADALRHAERSAKARLYAELGVRLDHHHAQRKVLVGIAPGQHFDGERVVSEDRVVLRAYESCQS